MFHSSQPCIQLWISAHMLGSALEAIGLHMQHVRESFQWMLQECSLQAFSIISLCHL
jgi:hypothetical protein